ncbi:DUF996 domain-containing protein [Candidatus Bathyarchaeota archaeon A05DMB-2]|jgi:uncharacterized membrane protein|nr:DUF996 domain-containing protein [Candidatus Bathyarchaeota archaeon A05DMB-2]
MTLETSKNLGGIGSILLFIGALPWIAPYGWILALVGLILALIGFKGLADYYKEAGIFNNALYAVIAAIVGGVAVIAIVFVGLVGFFSDLGINLSDWTNAAAFSSIDWTAIGFDVIADFLIYIAVAVVVAFVFLLITAVLLRKSLGLLSSKTGVGLFGTTGLIILIGAVLTIILIGVILIWIALLLMAVAFFSIRPQQEQPTMAAAPT